MTLNAVGILEKEMPQVRAGEASSKRNRKKLNIQNQETIGDPCYISLLYTPWMWSPQVPWILQLLTTKPRSHDFPLRYKPCMWTPRVSHLL